MLARRPTAVSLDRHQLDIRTYRIRNFTAPKLPVSRNPWNPRWLFYEERMRTARFTYSNFFLAWLTPPFGSLISSQDFQGCRRLRKF